MNFKIVRSALLDELYYLQSVVDRKQMIPILSHLLIDGHYGKIQLRATDLDITITTECEAEVREEGSICLPARKLIEIVKSLPKKRARSKLTNHATRRSPAIDRNLR